MMDAMVLGEDGSLYWSERYPFQGVNYHVLKVIDPNGKVRTINQRAPLWLILILKKMGRSIRTALFRVAWLSIPMAT